MKKVFLIMAVGCFLIAGNVFADGDLYVAGKIGVGTDTPEVALDVVGDFKLGRKRPAALGQVSPARIIIPHSDPSKNDLLIFDARSSSTETGNEFDSINFGGSLNTMTSANQISFWTTANFGDTLGINMMKLSNANTVTINPETNDIDFIVNNSRGVSLLRTDADTDHVYIDGTLDVVGYIYLNNEAVLTADYVFASDYNLESIDQHASYMWGNRHLKAIPSGKTKDKNTIELGSYNKGIVEELEKAHIYIEQLHNRLKVLEEKIAKIDNR